MRASASAGGSRAGRFVRWVFFAGVLGVVPCGLSADASQAPEEAVPPVFDRVIVLGFDGADPGRIREYVAAGELPHLAALARQGTLCDLATTAPAQSPVSWSSLITGLNPGRTGVFGFLRLVEQDGAPALAGSLTRWRDHAFELGRRDMQIFATAGLGLGLGLLVFLVLRMFRLRRWTSLTTGAFVAGLAVFGCIWVFTLLPASVQTLERSREGRAFYEWLAEGGLPSVALGAPMDCPPPEVDGLRILCGLGVPDIGQNAAQWAVYSTERRAAVSGTDGRVVYLEGDGPEYRAAVRGSLDPYVVDALAALDRTETESFEEEEARRERRTALEGKLENEVPFEVRWEPGRPAVRIRLPQREVDVDLGTWTPYLPVEFRSKNLVDRGLVRFYVARADTALRLYQEPVAWDPRRPSARVPISHPRAFAGELARDVGLFETTGWACATNAYRDEVIPEAAFLADVAHGRAERAAMLDWALERSRDDWRCLFAVFTGIDRVQHMLGRHLDPTHPAHDAGAATAGRAALRETYRAMDRIVGRVMESVDDRTAILIVSDHGFANFRVGVNLNAWLAREGYLAYEAGAGRASTAGVFPGVDWTRTRAFAFGLGQIYINRVDAPHGRGIVPRADVAPLAREIADKLSRLTHEGRRVVRTVDLAAERYQGPFVARGPDLLPGFERDYRVSRATVFGGRGDGIFVENASRWSGDHCSVAPELVPGVLVSSVRFERTARPRVVDIAPTVTALLGAPLPARMDGRVLPVAP